MKLSNIKLVYFSATYTTRKIVKSIAEDINDAFIEYDITQKIPESDVISEEGDLFIVGMPVYSGRIPAKAVEALNKFKGKNTPVIIVCVYGNREYDDALLELQDIMENNGFKVISAGTFIAQHSIFPKVAANRPDEKDIALIKDFARKSMEKLHSIADIDHFSDIQVKGNHPYKIPGAIPLHPAGDRRCTKCGICVKSCPVQAIEETNPRKTDKEKCIACGRCIVICPVSARHFGGILYKIAGKKFVKTHSIRKEPEMYF